MSTARRQPQIVALGGAGSSDGKDPKLDDYILSLSGSPRPKVCFLPTASGDADGYIVKFYENLGNRCQPSHWKLFRPGSRAARSILMEQDIVYVGGGSTVNMLAVWRAHGVAELLEEVWQAGIILAGVSAGSPCWFEAGVTDSYGKGLEPFVDGLKLLPGSNCPHYDSEAERRPAYHRFVAQRLLPGGVAADDGVGLHFTGRELAKVVSSRPEASAYRVELLNGEVSETRLSADVL